MKNLITLSFAVFIIANTGCDEPKQALKDNGGTTYKVEDWTPVASMARQDEFYVKYDVDKYNSRPVIKDYTPTGVSLPSGRQNHGDHRQFTMQEERFHLPVQAPESILKSTPIELALNGPKSDQPKQDPVVSDYVNDLDGSKNAPTDKPTVKDPTTTPAVQYQTETRYRRVARTRMRQVCGPMGTCRMVPETFYVNEPYTVQVAASSAMSSAPTASSCPTCGCTCGDNCSCKTGVTGMMFSESVMPLSAGTIPLFSETHMTYSTPSFYDSGFGNDFGFYDSGFSSSGNWFTDSNGNQFTCDNCPSGTARNTEGDFVPIRNRLFGSGAPVITAFQNAGNRIKSRRTNRRKARCQRWGF